MAISNISLYKGTIWTLGAFAVSLVLRLTTSVIMTRLLAPELFGVMQIVYSLQTGIELLTDLGIGQNIIYSKEANVPEFYNTAWSLQLTRGGILSLGWCLLAVPAAAFYHSPILLYIMPVGAIGIGLASIVSPGRFLLQKQMRYSKLTALEVGSSLFASVAQILYACISPTIWALLVGQLASISAYTIGSFCLLPGIRHRFVISPRYKRQILSFGKWIFLSSVVYFFSTNLDRLYLAKIIPLSVLGVYGIARNLSGLSSAAVLQLGSAVIFPFVTSHSQMPRKELRSRLAPIRFRFIALAGVAFSLFASMADLVIRLLYDQRYQEASWMLPILIAGSWFSVLSTTNESTLLGVGKPQYGAYANVAKFCVMFVGLTLGVARLGVFGGVVAVALGDFCRYVPLFFGQVRERLSFGRQDAAITLCVIVLIVLWEGVRHVVGLGTSFSSLSIANLERVIDSL